jgi:hypothetical protein
MGLSVMRMMEDPGPKKVPGTGLTLYPGGIEKTPTGLSNAFSESGLTADDLVNYAKKYNLPLTSNKDFQEAQYNLLNSTPQGRMLILSMQKKYGMPKAGTYADNILGARTLEMMRGTPVVEEPIVKTRRNIELVAPTGNLTKMVLAEPKKEKQKKYTIAWRDENSDNPSGTSSRSFATEKDYELELAKIRNKDSGRGFAGADVKGQGKGESSRSSLFLSNPFADEKHSSEDMEFRKENYRKQLKALSRKYNLTDSEIEDMVNNLNKK